jgi:sulfite exporter TauE/SafE
MWFAALVLGFAGSLHCLGMCSPLAMAVTNLRKPFFVNRLVYNGGRILCYALLGALVGTFGWLLSFSGIQNLLTIFLGCVLVVVGLTGFGHFHIPALSKVIQWVTLVIKSTFSRFLQRKTVFSIASLGMLNGLLPCGLTYLALTYCLSLDRAWDGFLFMLLFGVGTLPIMLGFTSLLPSLMKRFNFSFRHATTVTLIVVGLLLITRTIFVHNGHPNAQLSDEIVICK